MTEVVRNPGDAALVRCDWEAARTHFEADLARNPDDAAALDGLGFALFWLGDFGAACAARERAYVIYRGRGDERRAAAAAIYVATDFRLAGNLAAARGWLARARRCLDRLDPSVEHGVYEIELARGTDDPDEAARHSRAALALARELDDPDFEVLALGQAGVTSIARGRWDEGLALLDEAMAGALGGECTDAFSIGDACCQTLTACDQLSDVRRAAEWCQVIVDFIERRNYVPLYAWCRSIYAGVLVIAGRWDEGERELLGALARFDRHSGIGSRATAVVRLAELRLRQGRLEEAARLLDEYEESPVAVGPIARLRLAAGDAATAVALLERRLAALGPNVAERAPLLALAAEAHAALGNLDRAASSAEELTEVAERLQRENLLALSELIAGEVGLRRGDADGLSRLERAVEMFAALAMPYEKADARRRLATAYEQAGSVLAREEARAALAEFKRLGAARRADEAAAFLRALGDTGRPMPRAGGPEELTGREHEVLALLIEGLSNTEIAERLVISRKTAGHHVSHILAKLGVRNRTEAAARALAIGIRPR